MAIRGTTAYAESSEAHSFMRSPYKDIRNYDRAVQYE